MSTFAEQLKALDLSKGESHPDALRRTFLKLNRLTHDHLFSAYATNASGRKMSQASHRSAGAIYGMNPADVGTASGSSIGATGIVAYFRGHHLHVANVGNALAVMSRRGLVHKSCPSSTNHLIGTKLGAFVLRRAGCRRRCTGQRRGRRIPLIWLLSSRADRQREAGCQLTETV